MKGFSARLTPHPRAKQTVDRLQEMQRESHTIEAMSRFFAEQARDSTGRPVLNFSTTEFVGLKLSAFDFHGIQLKNAIFRDCSLESANFSECDLESADFNKSNLRSADFSMANASSAHFHGAVDGANFYRAKLVGADFTGSNLRRTDFKSADLTSARLLDITVDSSTKFDDIGQVDDAEIDRYAVACLGPDVGGLTEGNRMDMRIVDDVATLRSEFGGLWAVLHFAALIIFVFPYVRFLALQWGRAKFLRGDDAENSMTLLEALLRYIVTGGVNWQTSWRIQVTSFLPFLVYLTYNVARGALLWKTKKLETQQQVTGLPARFSLADDARWAACYNTVRWSFYFALVAVVVNTVHFLQMRIPIAP